MLEFLHTTPAQAVIWVTVLIVLCMIAFYIVKRVRNRDEGDEPSASELLTDFREMSEEGGITPQEFRQIKAVLGTKLQHQVESKDAEGDG